MITEICGPDDVVIASESVIGYIVQVKTINISYGNLGHIIDSSIVRIISDEETQNINIEFIKEGDS